VIVVRVDVRDLADGASLRAPFDERVSLQVDGQPVEAQTRGEVELSRTGQGVRLRGRVEATVALTCSRCLLPFQGTIRADLDEEFSLRPTPQARGALGPQDFITWVGPELHLDVTDIVRQHLQLAVPIAPRHRPDCRGLCPVCGANWNERLCPHAEALGRVP